MVDETIQRKSPLALYKQIAQTLVERIFSGELPPLSQLPTETELMREFQVSRITVRHAIDQLISDRLVVRKQGKGTFVRGGLETGRQEDLRGIYEALAATGVEPVTRLLSFQKGGVAPPALSALSAAKPDMELIFFERLYINNGAPFGVLRTWFYAPKDMIDWIAAENNTIYALLGRKLKLDVARAELSVSAENAVDLAKLLQCEPEAALLRMDRTSYGADGTAREYTNFFILAEGYHFDFGVRGSLPLSTKVCVRD